MSQLKGRRRRLHVGPTKTLQTRVALEDHSGFHEVAASTGLGISELLEELVKTHPVLLAAASNAAALGMSLGEFLTALIVQCEVDDSGQPVWAGGAARTGGTPELPGIREGLHASAA
ncbi:hypothetical protein [Parafrankia sp. CH37]|nr:hypothetical protein [Parafrankia sp. CH37]